MFLHTILVRFRDCTGEDIRIESSLFFFFFFLTYLSVLLIQRCSDSPLNIYLQPTFPFRWIYQVSFTNIILCHQSSFIFFNHIINLIPCFGLDITFPFTNIWFGFSFRLYISYTCPYAQRVWIARNFKVVFLY